jgi:hypothetical protein
MIKEIRAVAMAIAAAESRLAAASLIKRGRLSCLCFFYIDLIFCHAVAGNPVFTDGHVPVRIHLDDIRVIHLLP